MDLTSLDDFMNEDYEFYLEKTKNNKIHVQLTKRVGCFSCLSLWHPLEVTTYHKETAICPKCRQDTLLTNVEGLPYFIQDAVLFLKLMHWYAFCHLYKPDGSVEITKERPCK